MRWIIAGSRNFTDFNRLKVELYHAFRDEEVSEIVSGCANGADKLGEQWAVEKQVPIRKFLPDWNKHGKAAGPIRNEEMAKYANGCVVFWDGKSKGTKNMIDNAKKYNLKTVIVIIS